MADAKLENRNIPGMNRRERFAEAEHAENAGAALRRIIRYFFHEKLLVLSMFLTVLFGTFCGIYAPSVQSDAIDIISGSVQGNLGRTLIIMLAAYLLYSGSQLLQGLLSARLSQSIVKKMR